MIGPTGIGGTCAVGPGAKRKGLRKGCHHPKPVPEANSNREHLQYNTNGVALQIQFVADVQDAPLRQISQGGLKNGQERVPREGQIPHNR